MRRGLRFIVLVREDLKVLTICGCNYKGSTVRGGKTEDGTNRPFLSCCLSRFQSESWCSTIVREMSLICIRIRNSFPFEWLCTRTRFETEACSNSEMHYLGNLSAVGRGRRGQWSSASIKGYGSHEQVK